MSVPFRNRVVRRCRQSLLRHRGRRKNLDIALVQQASPVGGSTVTTLRSIAYVDFLLVLRNRRLTIRSRGRHGMDRITVSTTGIANTSGADAVSVQTGTSAGVRHEGIVAAVVRGVEHTQLCGR
jgi:hypothetical protein